MALPLPPTAPPRATSGSTRPSSPTSSTRDRLRPGPGPASRASAPTATATCGPGRRCARRTRTTDAGPGDPAGGRQPGGGRVRGRATRVARTSSARAWNGHGRAAAAAETANNIRLLRSRADSRLEFDDTAGAEGHPAHPQRPRASVELDDGARRDHRPARRAAASDHAHGRPRSRSNANVDASVTRPRWSTSGAASSTFSGVVKAQTLHRRVVRRSRPPTRPASGTSGDAAASSCGRRGTSASAAELDLRDPAALRPALQMYDDTDFAERIARRPPGLARLRRRTTCGLPDPGHPGARGTGRARLATCS